MLGTTRRTTNGPGNMVDTAAYTGFGEFLGGSADRRYGFAGAWQYQSHPGTGFPFLHVGHRYYDPAIGRFLQRDPIGIGGGFNVYAYVGNVPTAIPDPSGLCGIPEWIQWAGEGIATAGGATYFLPFGWARPVGGAMMACGTAVTGIGRGAAACRNNAGEIKSWWDERIEFYKYWNGIHPPGYVPPRPYNPYRTPAVMTDYEKDLERQRRLYPK
jgi:RHS repeat-associated protein